MPKNLRVRGAIWSFPDHGCLVYSHGSESPMGYAIFLDSFGQRLELSLAQGSQVYVPESYHECHTIVRYTGEFGFQCDNPCVILYREHGNLVGCCPRHAPIYRQLAYIGQETDPTDLHRKTTSGRCSNCRAKTKPEYHILVQNPDDPALEVCPKCWTTFTLYPGYSVGTLVPRQSVPTNLLPFQVPSKKKTRQPNVLAPTNVLVPTQPQPPPVTLLDWLTVDWEDKDWNA